MPRRYEQYDDQPDEPIDPHGDEPEEGESEVPESAEEPYDPADALAKMREERDQMFERLARATADYQNARKRLQTEMEQAIQYGNTKLIKSMLPVIDSFERALAVDPEKADAASILKGMQIVHDQWMNVLKSHHVEEIAPAEGEPFDPSRHEAMMQEADDRFREPAVVRLLQKGYSLHGRTLRPAQVVVSRSQG